MEIKNLFKEKKRLVIGAKETTKLLRTGKLEQVFIASNYPSDKKKQIEHLIGDSELVSAKQTSEEIGALLKKPFSISVIGLKKET